MTGAMAKLEGWEAGLANSETDANTLVAQAHCLHDLPPKCLAEGGALWMGGCPTLVRVKEMGWEGWERVGVWGWEAKERAMPAPQQRQLWAAGWGAGAMERERAGAGEGVRGLEAGCMQRAQASQRGFGHADTFPGC
jgi:hypothetical protein